jgi:MFS superfamily sulfate permease-like transporter
MELDTKTLATQPGPVGNRFDRAEWAGAFGDLGTLIPFVIAYLGITRLDPCGVLLGFGLSMIAVGVIYKTPFPVQPMKVIGAAAATQATLSAGAVVGASFISGLIWLVLGASGAAQRIVRLVPRAVTVGLVLGLGFAFMLQGLQMMAGAWVAAAVGLAGTLMLLTNRNVPAMFLLLLFGAGVAFYTDAAKLDALFALTPGFRLPHFALADITPQEWALGALALALPQVPLTLGNAVIAITEENNRLFPERKVSESKVCVSTGIMNLAGAAIGGVPMCHGAGGMAGHVRFGARTGGAPVILGVMLALVALFYSGSVQTLLTLFPPAVLGVILFLTGAQLALGACDFSRVKIERFATIVTAGFAVFNVGVAFVVGVALYHAMRRGLVKL